MIQRWAAGFLSLLLLTACSGVSLLNSTIPTNGMAVHHDIPYGPGPRQALDVYTPRDTKKPVPVIVFFYGGSWQNGKKDEYLFVAEAFTSRGYAVVIPDYRLYPDVRFPAFLQDGAAAVAWVQAHIANYGGDARNIFLAGHSAGAYNAVMLAVDKRYLRRDSVRGVIGIAGPYDFLPLTDPAIKGVFSSTSRLRDTQPVNYAAPGLPPMLLATGDADEEVEPKNTINMAKALRAQGNSVQEHIYPDVGHTGIVLSLARGFREKTPLLEQADAFVRKIMRPAP